MPQSPALPAPTRRQGASVNLAEPRAARTHEALTTALFDLLNERDLTEISISELCRTAGVHRTTFYGHYADIFAFAADSFGRMLDDLVEVSDQPDDLAQPDAALPSPEEIVQAYADSIQQALAHISDNRASYRMMFGTRVDAGFRRELFDRSLSRASLAVTIWQSQGYAAGVDPQIAAAWIAGGVVGVLEQWTAGDDTDATARIADVMASWPAWSALDAPHAPAPAA